MPVFSPVTDPEFGYKRSVKPKVFKAAFGDGYSQRAADGINNDGITMPIAWTNLPTSERDLIIDFFTAQNGHISFDYTLHDEDASRKFVCEEWDDGGVAFGFYDVRAVLTEVFEP